MELSEKLKQLKENIEGTKNEINSTNDLLIAHNSYIEDYVSLLNKKKEKLVINKIKWKFLMK